MLPPPTKRSRREDKSTVSVLKLLRKREFGCGEKITSHDIPQIPFRLPIAWRKRIIDPGSRNKIFASQWITDNHIVYGTKCNQLVLYDCAANKTYEIPLITSKSSAHEAYNPCACGIHAIQTNPSKNLLATGGASVNQIGVYSLCDFSPHCLLKDCHTDWIFDLRWLDDCHLASCSRDSSVALWRVPPLDEHLNQSTYTSSLHCPRINSVLNVKGPISHSVSTTPDDRFRAIEHLTPFNLLAVVSMSRRLYLYDAVRMACDHHSKPVFTLALRDAYQESVALRRWPSDPNCVALATHHCVILFDIRCSNPIGATGCCIHPPSAVSGVRSLNFSGSVLSYGSSNGQVHFYDLRKDKHLPTHLDVGPGWVKPNACINESSGISLPDGLPSLFGVNTPSPLGLAGWGAPPPSPSISVFLPNFPWNNVEGFTSRSGNLRIRLSRSSYQFSNLRSRRFASLIHSFSGLRTPRTTNSESIQSIPSDLDTSRSRRRRMPSSETDNVRSETVPLVADDSESENDDEEGIFSEGGSVDLPSTAQEESVVDRPIIHPSPVYRRPGTAAINLPLAELLSDFPSASTLSAHRRLVAVYTHEYDLSGTRLFTAGGPIASTYHGNVAALWE